VVFDVMLMIGVFWSNCRIRVVAETPSKFGMTISYDKPVPFKKI